MAFRNQTVNTVAAQLLSQNPARTSWLIYNNGASDCFVSGDGTLSTTNGMKIAAGAQLSFSRRDGDDSAAALYAVVAAATADLRIQESFESIVNLGLS